jgi:ribose/xylose/arabinose/galactoside ABC-type transport system permease subunit
VTLKKFLNLFGPVLALLLVFALFTALRPAKMLDLDNLNLMLRQSAVVGTAAIGMTIIIIAGGIDLSVGSVVAMTSVIVALLLKREVNPALAMVVGIVAGGAAGAINGSLVTLLRVVPFIVTLGTLLVWRGAAKWAANETSIYPARSWISTMMDKPIGVGVMLLVGAAAAFMLHYTRLGRHMYAIGSNEATARLCGIHINRVKVWVYTLGGLATGLAGVMHFGRISTGDSTSAMGLELNVIAAVVIGGGSLSGGEGSILGALVGSLIMIVISFGCTVLGLPNYVQEIITGVIIVIAVALDRLRHRKMN